MSNNTDIFLRWACGSERGPSLVPREGAPRIRRKLIAEVPRPPMPVFAGSMRRTMHNAKVFNIEDVAKVCNKGVESVRSSLGSLRKMGYKLECIGRNTYVIKSGPKAA